MSATEEFKEWLITSLKALNTDPDVFYDYIKGILDGEESDEEKAEALEGILAEISADDVNDICKEILKKWSLVNSEQSKLKNENKLNVEDQLASIMEKQALSVVETRTLTDEEKRYKQSILVQYGEVCDGTDSDENEEEAVGESTIISGIASVDAFLARNDNVAAVAQAETEKREKAKLESEKKKAQDKVNREKQNQAKIERREKEKKRTQKGERRR